MKTKPPPLTNEIASAIEEHLASVVSHSDLSKVIDRTPMVAVDRGPSEGKKTRLDAVLTWAIDNDEVEAGRAFVDLLFTRIRIGGKLGEIDEVGWDALKEAFREADYELTKEGKFRPLLLDSLAGRELSEAIQSYVQRAKAGESDAALVVGTSKDLLESVAAYICDETRDSRGPLSFPERLERAFRCLGMAYEGHEGNPLRTHAHDLEKSMYTVARSVNKLRTREGTGHGYRWLTSLSRDESKVATEFMGVISEYMLALHDELQSK